jgi:hypothetical protein
MVLVHIRDNLRVSSQYSVNQVEKQDSPLYVKSHNVVSSKRRVSQG